MVVETVKTDTINIAVVTSEAVLITDPQSSLDFMMSVAYSTQCNAIALDKRALAEDFFVLSSGLAGEVLQKFTNYKMKLAVFGDFSGYTSKALRDFFYETNKGNHIYFMPTKEEAIKKLTENK